ncbi:LysE family transporter [Rosenbergiella sp. S61]|uniref:LysE family transporter n=1 Tax=Rosenbergiella gaditana TaxID=2726987 RepID=A0ABS5SU05_9GAMM|nr:LysE family transporter [Rosenbergiella gaditana]MBT0723526.1 LysE family transporter [Rosenbergiella gaditana]
MSVFVQGFALGGALILPIGPQNTIVLRQGMLRRYAFVAATFCVVSDMLLITTGVLGGAAFLQHYPLLMLGMTWVGVVFLLWYSYGVIKEIRQPITTDSVGRSATSLGQLLLTLTAVTWLNPHVYLDTVVILGSLGSQIPAALRLTFVAGAISASIIWFYLLSSISTLLSEKLMQPRIQKLIAFVVVILLLTLAFRLASEGVVMLQQR